MSMEIIKDALSTALQALASDIEDEYREEAEEFLKQAGSDLAKQAWALRTAEDEAAKDLARELIDDISLSAELLVSEIYLEVADNATKRVEALRDKLLSYVKAVGSVLKVLGPILA